MDKKDYFREYYLKHKKTKFMDSNINEITQRLYEIQKKYSKGKKLLKAYLVYFYYCLGMNRIEIANYLQSKLEHVHDSILNIDADKTVWRSKMYYLANDIKDLANEYKTKI